MRRVCVYLLKSLLLVGLFIGCGADEEPPAPAVLQRVIPDNGSTAYPMAGIALVFNKKPNNLKMEPLHEFAFADEVLSKEWGKQWQRGFRHFTLLDIPIIYLDSTVVISAPSTRPVSVIEISWGAKHPQQFLRLSYIVQGPD